MKYFILVFIQIALLAGASSAEIELRWDFDNGSLGGWQQNESNELVLQHSNDSGGLWYFFKISGVKDQTLTFVFESVRADYYGNLNLPAISYNNLNWNYSTNVSIEPHTDNPGYVRYSFTHQFKQDTAWIAYTIPFHNPLMNDWLIPLASSPYLDVKTVCETSLLGQSLPLLEITNNHSENQNKSGWLIVCREDSHETASSWLGMGAALFLLSKDPLAAELRQDAVWWIVPLFDRDGVALGHAQHPVPGLNPNLFWTETWQEDLISFHEQRELKAMLQQIKDSRRSLNGVFRIHSNNWRNNVFRPEQLEDREIEYKIPEEAVEQYLPWFSRQESLNLDTRLSKFVVDLFPKSYAGFMQTDYLIPDAFGTQFNLHKSSHDLLLEGELFIRLLAKAMGYKPQSTPPFLLATHIEQRIEPSMLQYNAACVYFDPENRPPNYVRVIANGQEINLSPLDSESQEYYKGVIYNGFFTLEEPLNSYAFTASNGQTAHSEPKYTLPQPSPTPSE